MQTRYDIIIVGSGPAGISAAVNSVIRNKKVKVFGSKNLSDKLTKAPRIDNYLGFYQAKGPDLAKRFTDHIDEMDIEIDEENVEAVYALGTHFAVATNKDTYESTAVIVAPGVSQKKKIPGEDEFLGKGVGYCATCDAPIYKNRSIAIVGYEPSAEHEVNFMADVASQVTYIPRYKELGEIDERVRVIKGRPKKFAGEEKVRSLQLDNQEIEAEGFFVLREAVALDQLVPGIQIADHHYEVNRNLETNIKGLFAAGDVTGEPYQYMKAAGEGQVAALNAVRYIDNNFQQKKSS